MIWDIGGESNFKKCVFFLKIWGTTASLRVGGNYPSDRERERCYSGSDWRENVMRKQGPHLKKLNFEESRVIFSVLKRRKKGGIRHRWYW